jgi:hypothetical protein
MPPYDAFICHAWEDKETFVAGFAHRLSSLGASIWYDDYSLEVGDSLREKIDEGLRKSRFGIVILSPSFFAKRWPQAELNAMFSEERRRGTKVILPLLHQIAPCDIGLFSPLLADRLCLSTAVGLESVVTRLMPILRLSDADQRKAFGATATFGRIGRQYVRPRHATINCSFVGLWYPYYTGPSIDDWEGTTYEAKDFLRNEPPLLKHGDRVRLGTVLGVTLHMLKPEEIESEVSGTFDAYLVEPGTELAYQQPIARILLD